MPKSEHGHIAICLHDTVSRRRTSFKRTVDYCQNKWSKPAYNMIISREGEVAVLTEKTSFNAGKINKLQFGRLERSHKTMEKPPSDSTITRNSKLYGVALDRSYKEPISKKQWRKTVKVLTQKCYEWSYDPKRHIVDHATLTIRKGDCWPSEGKDVLKEMRKDVHSALKKKLKKEDKVVKKIEKKTVDIPRNVRGLRNRNPGNIRNSSRYDWRGQVGKDEKNFAVFRDDFYGIRALARDLRTKHRRGLNTIRKIIEVYAPPSENDTQSYIKKTAIRTKKGANEVLSLNEKNWLLLVKAIIKHENGVQPYSDKILLKGIRAGLG